MSALLQQMSSKGYEYGEKIHFQHRILFPPSIARPVRENVGQENTERNYLQQMDSVNDLP